MTLLHSVQSRVYVVQTPLISNASRKRKPSAMSKYISIYTSHRISVSLRATSHCNTTSTYTDIHTLYAYIRSSHCSEPVIKSRLTFLTLPKAEIRLRVVPIHSPGTLVPKVPVPHYCYWVNNVFNVMCLLWMKDHSYFDQLRVKLDTLHSAPDCCRKQSLHEMKWNEMK